MARTLAPIPLGTPITDRDGTITAFFRQRWQDVTAGWSDTGTVAHVQRPAQTGPLAVRTVTPVGAVSVVAGASGGTTAPIDTTGATLLLVSVSAYVGLGTVAVTDSKANTWTPLTLRAVGVTGARLWSCVSPTVGAGHTVTVAGTTIYATAFVSAFGGVGSYQTESGATSAASPLAAGLVTPAGPGALVVLGRAANLTTTDTVSPAGFTLTTRAYAAGASIAGSFASLVRPTAVALNPTVSWPEAATENAVTAAVFLPASAPTTLFTVQTSGTYRVSWYLRKTRADGVSSSATVTIGFLDLDGQALTYSGPALTLDSVGAWQGIVVPIRCLAPSDLTIAVAYASTTPGQMRYDLEVSVEFLP